MMSSTIGEVQEIKKTEYVFEWRINNFFSLSGINYASPTFNFDGESWHLIIYPNVNFSSAKFVYSISLCRELTGTIKKVFWSFTLKTENGKKHYEQQCSEVFGGIKTNDAVVPYCYLENSKLLEKKSILVPSGILTVVCTIFDCSEYAGNESDLYRNFLKCSYCEDLFLEPHISIHEEMCLNIRCTACKKKWDDHECSNKDSEGTAQHSLVLSGNKVLRDFKEFFLSQEHCDVTLKVKEEEFKAHKAVLCARSSVFASTFRHDMKEKATGTVNIEDCDPASFRDFLRFLYCGDVENISSENVFGLFTAADKYDVQDLRSQCLGFIKRNLSVDTFCNTLTLALQHSEKELIDFLADFFSSQMEEVVVTHEWQSFILKNPIAGNEILIKALACKRKSKKEKKEKEMAYKRQRT